MKTLFLLRRDRSSMVALIFAILAIPLIGIIGLAIDFGALSLQRVRLNAAADSAALAAVNAAANAYASNPLSNYIAFGQQAGSQTFTAQAGSLIFGNVPTPTVSVSKTNGTFAATVSYSSSVTASLAQVLGTRSFTIAGNSGSTVTPQRYVAIQMFLDNSASMGLLTDPVNSPSALQSAAQTWIGTTTTSTNLFAASEVAEGFASVSNSRMSYSGATCAFACHNDTSTSGPGGYSNDWYGVARANGIQMRFDILRSAVQNVISQMQAMAQSNYLSVGLYTFATTSSTVFALSNNLSAGGTAAAGMQLQPSPPYCTSGGSPPKCNLSNWNISTSGWGFRNGSVPYTSFENSVSSFVSATLTPVPVMTGTTAATAARYVFLVTDGVDDYTTSALNASCCNQFISPMNTTNGSTGASAATGQTACDQLKATGVTVMVLYTTYEPDTGVPTYDNEVAPIVEPGSTSTVVNTLKACATPGNNFFQANSIADIGTQLNNMLLIATASAGRFTQ